MKHAVEILLINWKLFRHLLSRDKFQLLTQSTALTPQGWNPMPTNAESKAMLAPAKVE